MYCSNCRRELPDGAKFCGYCGCTLQNRAVNQPTAKKKKCSKCLNEYSKEYMFCENCGTLLQSVPVGYFNDYCSLRLAGVYFFSGTSISLMPQATGMLSFYNDKMEFAPPNGHQQLPANNYPNSPYGSYPYENIVSATEGNSIAVKSLTVRLKDGRVFTFSKLGSYSSTIMRILRTHIEQA